MKRKTTKIALALLAVLALSTTSLVTKAQGFEVGDKDLNISIGFGRNLFLGSGYRTSLPNLAISGDYGLRDDWGPGVFSIGAYLSANTYKFKYTYWVYTSDYGWKYTEINIAARATYHYQFVKKLDTYGGVLLGVQISNSKSYGDWPYNVNDDSNAGVSPLATAFVGAKYYFNDNFAGMCELYVYDIAIFNLGIGLKF